MKNQHSIFLNRIEKVEAYAGELQWVGAVVRLLRVGQRVPRRGKRSAPIWQAGEIDALHCRQDRAQQGASSKSSRQFGFLPVIIIRVVNHRPAQRERGHFGTHLAGLPHAQRGCGQ